jgi:hypothetical protein
MKQKSKSQSKPASAEMVLEATKIAKATLHSKRLLWSREKATLVRFLEKGGNSTDATVKECQSVIRIGIVTQGLLMMEPRPKRRFRTRRK